jgi:hypothetical protein
MSLAEQAVRQMSLAMSDTAGMRPTMPKVGKNQPRSLCTAIFFASLAFAQRLRRRQTIAVAKSSMSAIVKRTLC